MGRAKEACEYLDRAVAIAPDDAVSVEYLMEATAESKGIRSITKELERLRMLSKSQSWVELENSGRKLIMDDPCQGEVLGLVAYSLQQQERLAEALEFARRATEVSPDQWLSQYVAGYALKGMGRTKEACEYLRRAVAIAPEKAVCVNHLIAAVAVADGVHAAAAEYAAHCRRLGWPEEIQVARISTAVAWAQACGQAVVDAGEGEEIPFEAPQLWNRTVPPERYSVMIGRPQVVEVADARIMSGCSLVLTRDGAALNDLAGHPRFGRYVSFSGEGAVLGKTPDEVLLRLSGYETRTIAAGIFLAGSASEAFGHWFPDMLPRLQFLRQHPEFGDFPLIVDEGMPASHYDHLARLADNPLIRLRAGESLVCGRLLMASSPSFCPVEMLPNDIPVHELPGLSPRAMRFLRGGSDGAHCGPRTGRFFLARRNMKWRRLLNEAEIVAELSKSGFETVFLEELDAGQQIELFRRAEWIVAPNGSALLNLIFSDPAVKLLILSQPELFNWGTFQGPMRALGYSPVWLCGEEAGASEYKHSDYRVSIQQIRLVLAEMGL